MHAGWVLYKEILSRDRMTAFSDMTSQTIYLSHESKCRLLLGHINPWAGREYSEPALPPKGERNPPTHTELRDLAVLNAQKGMKKWVEVSEGQRQRDRDMMTNYSQPLLTCSYFSKADKSSHIHIALICMKISEAFVRLHKSFQWLSYYSTKNYTIKMPTK